MKGKKDILFEVTNDIFYLFFIGVLIKYNSKERWNPFMTSFYIYIVVANTLIITFYSVIFFIFSIKEYCKKRNHQKKIMTYRGSSNTEHEISLKTQMEQRNSVFQTDTRLNGSSKDILQKISDVSADENVDHLDNHSVIKLTKNDNLDELNHHRRSDIINIGRTKEVEDQFSYKVSTYLREKESLNHISHKFLKPVKLAEGDATSFKQPGSYLESVPQEEVKQDFWKFNGMRSKIQSSIYKRS